MGATLPLEKIQHYRARAAAGLLAAPRIVAATGRALDGEGSSIPHGEALKSEQTARIYVRNLKTNGADFIKVHNLLPRETFVAIAEESSAQKLPLAGHVPLSMTATEVSDLGQKSIEHASDLLFSTSSDELLLRTQLVQQIRSGESYGSALALLEARGAESFDKPRADALYKRFVRNGTWHCPTLLNRKLSTYRDDLQLATDPRMKYIPQSDRARWQFSFAPIAAEPRELAGRKKRYERTLEIVGGMQNARVGILAGTDVLNPYTFPGSSLHEELDLLVEAGLTAAEALRAATLNPAEYMGMTELFGTVEKGKTADLILLDANPYIDIRNTQRIFAVILNGKLISRDDLNKMLVAIEQTAKAS